MSYTQINPNSQNLEDLKLTPDEVNRFTEAMKKKEFVDMLGDYMKEISDPANKNEYEQYLKQLEREGELPKGTQLVKPVTGFCMKSTLIQNKDKKNTQKLFINICSHHLVEKATNVQDKKGVQWRIPYIAGKVRLDQTNSNFLMVAKEVCSTIEVCYHTEVLELAYRNAQYQKLVCDTAIEAVEKQLKDRDEKVSKDYKVLSNLKCKGGDPATLTVRSKFLEDPKAAENFESEMSQRQGGEKVGPKLFQEFQKAQNDREKEKKLAQEKQKQEIETQEEEKSKPVRVINAPEYKIVYTYPTQYQDFIEAERDKRKLPEYITVNIDLPSSVFIQYQEGIANLRLDIRERLMIFEIPQKHYLEIKLPYDVEQEQGDAKYDKKNKKLKVKLPLSKSNFNTLQMQQEQMEAQIASKYQPEIEVLQDKKEHQEVKDCQENNQQPDFSIQNDTIQENEQNLQQNIINNPSLLEITNKSILNIYKQDLKEDQTNEGPLVTEISYQILEQKASQLISSENKVEQKDIYVSLNYKTQETEDNYFFIFNIQDYDQSKVKCVISLESIYIMYENNSLHMYKAIKLQKLIDSKESKVSFVKDYIVIQIKKIQPEFWDNQFFQDFALSFEEFSLNFQELYLKQQDELQNQESYLAINQQEQNNLDEKKQSVEEQITEQQKDEQTNEQTENIVEKETITQDMSLNKINQIANSLQFIDYKCAFAYSSD